MKAGLFVGATTAAAFGAFSLSSGNPVPSLGQATAFDAEGDTEEGKLSTTKHAIVQCVDAAIRSTTNSTKPCFARKVRLLSLF